MVDDGSPTPPPPSLGWRRPRRQRRRAPPGWAGKPWACWTGAAATTAPGLVFLDADVRLAPDGLAAPGLPCRGRRVAVGPAPPRHRPPGRGAVRRRQRGRHGRDRRIRAPPVPPTVAFGPCLVATVGIPRRRRARRRRRRDRRGRRPGRPVPPPGRPSRCGPGARHPVPDVPGGPPALFEGWTKNLAVGGGAAPPGPALLSTPWVAAALASPARRRLGRRGGVHLVAAAAVYAAFAVQTAWLARQAGRFGAAPAHLYPVAVAAFVVLFACSVVRVPVLGSVTWRGRRIAVGRAS